MAIKDDTRDALNVYDAAGMRVAERVNDVWRFLVYDAVGTYHNVTVIGEHGRSVAITTLYNPGWAVSINVHKIVPDTYHEDILFEDSADDDWVFCSVKSGRFEGRCDSRKLTQVLEQFLKWTDSQSNAGSDVDR